MIYQEHLLKIVRFSHISEKASMVLEKSNVVVFKVLNYATKPDIKNAMQKLFEVKVNKVNIVVVPKKLKRSSNKIGFRCNWKKAYITLEKGYKVDFLNKIKDE